MLYDVIIIGGGVAGITASMYSASRGMSVCVIEKEGKGGVIGKVSTITHYPGIINNESGKDYYERLFKQFKTYDVDYKLEEVIDVKLEGDIKTVSTSNAIYEGKTIIIASGTSPNHIGLKEENTHLHKGVSYCVLEDIDKYNGKEVFIVGGSDGAIKEALYLAKYAKKVNIIHFEDSITAVAEFRIPAQNLDNIEIHLHKRICELDTNGELVTGVYLKDEHDDSITKIDVPDTCIFIYAGATPNTSIFKDILTLKNGFIASDDKMQTSVAGVYVAGDIRQKPVKQVATAANDGAIAAISAFAYINS